ncbi:hypothetical protein I4F81_007259 [Pyropia yezoensis]|uniref:Uncharacterized protein n=1 Tax=Pyropia yezoensis TaxID=2788 RepID=A0ACC3C3M4_PYRYE|nr:hypothetical protein I4F81_007259 [Neopyropia yezoensis]
MITAHGCRRAAVATTAALVVVTVAAASAAAVAIDKHPPAGATPSAAPAGDNPPVDSYVPKNGGVWEPTAAGGGDGVDTYYYGDDAGADEGDAYANKGAARGSPCDYDTMCEVGTTCAAPPGGGGGDSDSGTRCRSPAPPCGRCDGAGVTCLKDMTCVPLDDGGDSTAGGVCLPLKASERHQELCDTVEPLPRGRTSNGRTPEREAELLEKYGRPNEYRWAYYWAMWDAYNRKTNT